MSQQLEALGLMQVQVPVVPVYDSFVVNSLLTTQVMLGEHFVVEKTQSHWAYGYPEHDPAQKGWIKSYQVVLQKPKPLSHRVSCLQSVVYSLPGVKSQATAIIGMNARVSVEEVRDGFGCIGEGKWVYMRHLARADAASRDWVVAAEQCRNVPYLWGGRNPAHGLDCSGLVAAALLARGIYAPHNSAQMEAELGYDMPRHALLGLMRGDLVFWKGHVGIMLDADNILHATAEPYCAVVEEPLSAVVARRKADITRVRRIE